MKAMRSKTGLGTCKPIFNAINGSNTVFPEFHADVLPTFICIQDTIHIDTKLRTRLLKSSIILPMDNFTVTPAHLRMLINQVSKVKHCLTETDLSPKDKINFDSFVKISDPKVWSLLEQYIPESEATRAYLN